MRLNYDSAVKFYTESNNMHQLSLAYTEIEKFMETYSNFKLFWELDVSNKTSIQELPNNFK
jgi:hypothetical protein